MFTNLTPMATTIAKWNPKCNSEGEVRISVDLETPLTPEVLEHAPDVVQRAAKVVQNLDNACDNLPVSKEFLTTIELYTTPDHTTPIHTLPTVEASNLVVWRPTLKEGPSKDLFLSFNVNVGAGGPEGGALAAWLLGMQRKVAFINAHQVQGTLPGMPVDAKPRAVKKVTGKDAAAGKD